MQEARGGAALQDRLRLKALRDEQHSASSLTLYSFPCFRQAKQIRLQIPPIINLLILMEAPQHLMATFTKVESMFKIAEYLQQSLPQNQLVDDLSVYLQALPLSHKAISLSDRYKLRRHGVALWNICGRLRKTEQPVARKELLSQGTICSPRALAYFLLDSASEAGIGSLRNALKIAKECLDDKLVELTLKISERAAILQETLDVDSTYIREYFLLRLALAWRQDRIDLAEHFFAKLQTKAIRTTAADALYCTDLFLNIGRDCLEKKKYGVAAKWLERAAVMLQEYNLVGPDATNLHVNVLHTYARALLGLGDADTGLSRARGVLQALQRFCGADDFAFLSLKLDIVSRGDPGAHFAAVDTLSLLQPTESHYTAVMHHLIQMRELDPGRACRTLQQYLLERLALHGNDEWTEDALITLVWMYTSSECAGGVAALGAVLTELSSVRTNSISAEATHGVLVFLWKRIEADFTCGKYHEAASWCNLALQLFSSNNMDDLKAVKLKRKLLQCQLNRSEPEAILEAALTISPTAMRGSSLFELDWFMKNLVDVAIRFYNQWPVKSIIQLLDYVSQLPILMPQDIGVESSIVVRLKEHQAMCFFALAMLHTIEAREANSTDSQFENYNKVSDHIQSFDQHIGPLMNYGSRDRPNDCDFASSEEIRSSFLAQRITLLSLEFEASLHVLDTGKSLDSHKTNSDRLTNIITSAATYHAPAKTYALFADLILCGIAGENNNTEPPISVDDAAKLLRQLIDAARGREAYGILQASRWIRCVVHLLLGGSEKPPNCRSMELLEGIVEQVVSLASTGRFRCQDGVDTDPELGEEYPADELEWLATTLFNLAVDFYVAEKEDLGRKWARNAVEIADVLAESGRKDGDGDGKGLLARVLRGKMGELGWSA